MPARRTKSCINCRSAKARCSQSTPCLRCSKRHLECNYTTDQSHQRDSRRIRLIRPATRIGNNVEARAHSASAVASTCFSGIDENQDIEIVPATTDAPSALVTYTEASELYVFDADVDPSIFEPLSPSWFLNIDTPSDVETFFTFENLSDFRLIATPSYQASPNTKACRPQLSLRTRSLQQGSLTAKMVFSKLRDYTHMLADGQNLPPFIHPPCRFGLDDQCIIGMSHQCLPEVLAVCANLTRMFHAQSSGGRGYVWQQICTHLRQLCDEVSSDGVGRLLYPCR
jgi:hypothetical protein